MRFIIDPRPLAAVLAAAALAACSPTADAKSGHTTTSQSGGDVTASWNPAAVNTVAGVDAAALHTAIGARLATGRPSGLTDDHWGHVKALYKHYGESPLWLNADGLITDRVNALTNAMLDAQKDALRLDEYPFADVTSALRTIHDGKATPEQLANADVLLTASYVALGEDLMTGQVSPKAYKQDWHISPPDAALDSALARGLVTDELQQSLASMRPQDEGYEALRQQLAHYRQLVQAGGWTTVPAGRALKPGERDTPARLDALRARLRAEGYDVGGAANGAQNGASNGAPNGASDSDAAAPAADTSATASTSTPAATRRARGGQTAGARAAVAPGVTGPGIYDHALAGAVAQYQANHAIVVDSILGPGTVESMNKPATYRLGQIAANLERYRWMPRSLGGRYVYVNVPAFRLTAYDSGKKALEMKVIVGQNYQDKTTPVFADTMETVVFRPYWNITDDIAEKEIWPKVQADPNYLEENEMETYKEGGKTRIRQKPGDKNSLGYVKFLFPNDYNIYLHDTPQHSLFDKDVRAFSHGCIRVEKPVELAEWVLGWPEDRVRAAMQTGPDNQSVKVPQKLPVYITYFTTYVDNGVLHFGNDLYERDDALIAAASAAAMPDAAVQSAVAGLRDSAGR